MVEIEMRRPCQSGNCALTNLTCQIGHCRGHQAKLPSVNPGPARSAS